jgi:hypothetical protein
VKLLKFLSRVVLVLASLSTALQPVLAQTYKTRVPLSINQVNPTLTVVDMGAAPVDVTLQANTYYTNNTGADIVLTAGSFSVSGGAQVVSTSCIGTVYAGSSCAMTVALLVSAVGDVSGTIQVATGNPAGPDAIVINATGVSGAPGLVSTPPSVDFGMRGVNQGPGSPITITISNTGDTSADITSVVSTSSSFLVSTSCNRIVLTPGQTCDITARFSPRALGTLNTNLRVSLGDGTNIAFTALTGTGVQGIPKWIVPPTFQFYDMLVNQWSPDREVTLQNIGQGDFKIVSLSVQGDTSFTLAGTTCPIGGLLSPNQTCTVAVRAKVTDANAHNANIVLTSSQSSSPTTKVPLTARALYSQAIAYPSSLDFGDVPSGQTITQTVTLYNPGTLPLNVGSITTSAPYAVSGDCPATLQPLGSCSLNVSITGTLPGPVSALVSIVTDATVAGTSSIWLTANVVAASTITDFDVSASSLNFGGVTVGQYATQTLSVLNTGTNVLTLDSITASGEYLATHNCTAIVPGSTCEVTVRFTPTFSGVSTGTLALTAGGVTRNVALSGTGLTAVLVSNAATLDFGNVTLGESATQTLSFTNEGTASATPSVSFQATGYSVTGTTCGPTLAAGASCSLDVTFTPTQAQVYPDLLTVTGATTGSVLVNLTGTGVVPLFSSFDVSPSIVDFGTTPVGTPVTINVAVLNSGTRVLNFVDPVSNAPEFTTTHNCTGILPDSICIVGITFTPNAAAPFTGTLTLNDGGAVTRIVQLSGVGAEAKLTVDLPSLSFGDVVIGQSDVKTITISNTGALPATLGVSSTSVYTVTDSTCSAILAPGASCALSVTFNPVALGSFPGTLTIAGSTDGDLSVPLTGTGIPVPTPVTSWTLSSTSLNFGTVPLNSTNSLSISVLNDGETHLPSFSATTDGQGYTVANGCISVSLAPGASCNLVVTFNPVSPGRSYPGSIVLVSGAQSIVVPLTGAVADVPALTITGGLDYDVFNLSIDAPLPRALTVTNSSVSTTISGIAFNLGTATTQTYYIQAGNDQCTGASLAPGASCVVTVVFKPTATGQFNQAFTATSTQGVTKSVTLTGRGGLPVWDISPQTLDFGTILTGSTYAQTVVIKNTGTTVAVSSISATSSNPRYTVDASRCVNILPGWSCTVDVQYNPNVGGAPSIVTDTGTITFTGNSVSRTISVTGKSGFVEFQSSFFDQNNMVIGAVVAVPVSFVNTGSLPADVTASASMADGYLLVGAVVNEQEFPKCKNVLPGDSCTSTVYVRVTEDFVMLEIPMTAHYSDTVSGQSEDIPQTGFYAYVTADASVLLGAQALAYGDVTIGDSLTRDALVLNQTNQPLNLSLFVTGSNAFAVTHDCLNVPAAGSCRIQAKFSPTSVAAYHGDISVNFGNGEAPRTITLDGNGAPGKILKITYNNVTVGTTAYEALQISSDGAIPLGNVAMGPSGSVDAFTVSVTNLSVLTLSNSMGLADTQVTGVTTTCGVTLAPGATCSRTFQVGSGSLGGAVAQLYFNYRTPANGKVTGSVPLNYNGTAPYSLSSPNFGTLTAGQSATQTVTLANNTSQPTSISLVMPSSSFTAGPFTGACAGGAIPANTSCTFSMTFTPTSADFSSLSFGSLIFKGVYGDASARVYASTYTPPPPPVVTPSNPTGVQLPAKLNVRVITNRQMNAAGSSGHYFSSYDAPCNNGSVYQGYQAMDTCMFNLLKQSYAPTYGIGVACFGVVEAGPYPYFQSWGYQCQN